MFIEEMQILVDCKRLVENMLDEKKFALEMLRENGKDDYNKYFQKEIKRMEDALSGKGVRPHVHP